MTCDDFKPYPGENTDRCSDCGEPLEDGCCVVIECDVYQLEVHGGPSVVDAPALPVATETVIDRFDALKRGLGGA